MSHLVGVSRWAAAAALVLAGPGALRAGSYELASALRLRDVLCGTEQVKLLPDGGFEGGGQGGWKKKAGRWGQWTVGPHVVPAPGACGRLAVRLDAETGSGSHQIDGLPPYRPGWRRAFSAYVWMPGAEGLCADGTAPGVPGEQHICFFRPAAAGAADHRAYAEGFYVFGDFAPLARQLEPDGKVSYNIKGGGTDTKGKAHRWGFGDAAGAWQSVILAGDNLADTPILEFAPPVLRHAAAAEFSEELAPALRRLAPTAGDAPAPDAGRAAAMLARLAAASEQDWRVRNALAAACMVRFARDPSDANAWRAALAAWEASLTLRPDQPLVRHRLGVYRGYVPPQPFAPEPPPPAAAGAEATPQPASGRYDPATAIRLRELVPGTERVTLAPGGDFEDAAAWVSAPDRPGLRIGRPASIQTRLRNAAPLWGGVLYCEAPLAGEAAEVRSPPLRLERGAEYILSAYITPLGQGDDDAVTGPGAVTIGLEGMQPMGWGWPRRHAYTAHEGLFVFASVSLDDGPAERAIVVRCGPWLGKAPAAALTDADGRSRGVSVLIDQVAVTRAADFRPPVLRGSAHLEFRAMLDGAPAGTERGADAGDFDGLRAAAKDASSGPDAHNRLAAACMVEFLRDPACAERLAEALACWRASLAADDDQPIVHRLLAVWSGCRPVPSIAPHSWRAER